MNRTKKPRKKLTAQEKESFSLVNDLVKKPTMLKPTDFVAGQIIMYSYKAKYDQNPYDQTPMAMILLRNKKHTLALNWNWIPPKVRISMMAMIMKKNKRNIERGLPLDFTYQGMRKYLMRSGAPALRKYINKRISPKGVVIPQPFYNKVIHLRSEHFIGISAEQAWAMGIAKMKQRKGTIK